MSFSAPTRTTIMSITRQGPGSAGLAGTADTDGLLGEAAHYGGGKSPSAAQRLAPLRELINDRLLDALLERSRDEAGGLRLTGEGSMLGELVKAVLERALEVELTAHLGYPRHDPSGHRSGNSRNGTISKKVQTGIGPVGIEVPRDRAGDFEPRLVPKRSGRVSGGLDDMIISLYAHGMSVRDILHHLRQVYGTDLSAETVSRITDAVLEEVKAWQSRPLDPVQAPRMNATCERLAGTLRRELLDRVLILSERHLRAVLTDYQAHYNTARPHQGIAQRVPDDEPDAPRATATGIDTQQIRRKPILGSLINEYTHAA
jgi:hypothetical protein